MWLRLGESEYRNMISKREYNLDFLRIAACFMVILLHTSAQNWDSVPFTSFEWMAFNTYNSSVRSAVALFFMLSGKLFLSKETLSFKPLFLRNILKLLFVYGLWSLLYAIDTIGILNILNNFDLHRFASVTIASKYHLWYLPELISVYLMLPVLFAVKYYQNGKILNYICIMIFLFTIVRSSILLFVDSTLLTTLSRKVNFSLGSCCGYFILGYVLDQNKGKLRKIKTPVLLFSFAALVGITATGAYLDSAAKGAASGDLYNDIFITTCFEAIVLFTLFLRVPSENINEQMGLWLQKISKYTFFVYLIHPFILEHLKSLFLLHTLSFNPWLSTPIIAVGTFLVSMCIARIIDMMPGLNKFLL